MIAESERLPRRDWIILPLLSLLTLAVLLGLSEVAARTLWQEQQHDRCVMADPVFGFRFKPDCVARVKSAETPWIENAYNACGFRTAEPCGPKPPGDFRVSVIGSSISSGYLVPYRQSFPAVATAEIRQRCNIPVDFQNLAVPGTGLEKAPLHLDAALALHPDVLLMALTVHDLEILREDEAPSAAAPGAAQPQAAGPPRGGVREFLRDLVVLVRSSRAALVAQHFLYQNLDSYLPLYLEHGDEADFLRPPLSAAWQRRLALFDAEVGQIAARARQDGVPFVLVFVPARAQAMMLQWKHLSPGIDPTLLGRDLGDIAARHGIDYIDLTHAIGDQPDVTSLFYPVDAHPNAGASAIIGGAVADQLLRQAPTLARCRDQARVAR